MTVAFLVNRSYLIESLWANPHAKCSLVKVNTPADTEIKMASF